MTFIHSVFTLFAGNLKVTIEGDADAGRQFGLQAAARGKL